jgi:hypothetical protein
MTAIAPFIGSIILLNKTAVDYLKIPEGADFLWHYIANFAGLDPSLLRLKFLYFGLVSIGLGALVFLVRCPKINKEYASSTDFVLREKDIISNYNLENYFFAFILNFAKYDELARPNEAVFVPKSDSKRFTALTRRATYESIARFIDEQAESSLHESGQDLQRLGFIDTDEFINLFLDEDGSFSLKKFAIDFQLDMHRTIENARMIVREIELQHKLELLTIIYDVTSYRRFYSRLWATFFYGVGFIILSIPTIVTFINVLIIMRN